MTSSTVDHTDHGDHDAASHTVTHDHPSDALYWVIFGFLVAITGAEVSLSYMQSTFGKAFLPLLLIMMAVKFWTVVSFFMHLRFDNKLFSILFYSGLALAAGVYSAFLTTTEFWVN